MKKPSVKIDTLLEPLLPPASDEQADDVVSRLISVYAEPVIKGIIRYKLHLSSHHVTQRAEADDIYQGVLVQFLTELNQLPLGVGTSQLGGPGLFAIAGGGADGATPGLEGVFLGNVDVTGNLSKAPPLQVIVLSAKLTDQN